MKATGSSPRCGARSGIAFHYDDVRFIPAHAGHVRAFWPALPSAATAEHPCICREDHCHFPSLPISQDYPRTCGGVSMTDFLTRPKKGLSPQMQGCHDTWRMVDRRRGPISAYAELENHSERARLFAGGIPAYAGWTYVRRSLRSARLEPLAHAETSAGPPPCRD